MVASIVDNVINRKGRVMAKTHDHWRVTVETSGEHIVSIEPELLAGREPSEADENAIRAAAYHLLGFIGDPLPIDGKDTTP